MTAEPGAIARGESLGRFLVLDELGTGGMGVVLRAYDPDLDRRVAIKLLRADREDDAEGQSRMLREAQAMARVSDPNVVPVHEVGSWRGRVFLVMELVEGSTLSAWLAAAPRSWREIVVTFAGAGRGLGAAHAAGLVHRDFKPENVLVGADGRARVTDFGLVGLVARDGGDPEDPDVDTLTLTGMLVGTPRFMAPEQHRREPATARSDQFAFCVALWSAVYGAPPFEGEGYRALARNVIAGKLATPARPEAAPAHVRAALARGLALDPDERFPDMPALLAALAHDPDLARRRRRAWLGGLAVTVTAGLTLALAWPTPAEAPAREPELLCRGAEQRIAETWSEARRAALAQTFATAGARGAEVWAAIEPQLDAYAGGWATARTEACEATRLRGEQSEELLDLRIGCLDRRAVELSALLDELAAIGGQQPDGAAQAIPRMTAVATCADRVALTAPVPPPVDPVQRAHVDELAAELATVKARVDTGRYADAAALGATLLPDVEAAGHLPLYAEALLQVADARAQAGDVAGARDALAYATWAAEASGHDAVAARAWTVTVFVAGFLDGDAAAGAHAVRRADAAVRRLGDPPEPRGRLELNEGALAYGRGDTAAALTHWERALALWSDALGDDHPELGRILNNLGAAYGDRGRHDDAVDAYARALALWQPALGDAHPMVGRVLQNLAAELTVVGELDEADRASRRALAAHERALGAEHAIVALDLKTLATVETARGHLDEAATLLTRAREIDRAHGGDTPWTLVMLAEVRRAERDLRAARELTGAALALARGETNAGDDHVPPGIVLGVLAEIELDAGAPARAERLAREAIADLEQRVGAEAPQLAQPLIVLGRARAARDVDPVPQLERALTLLGTGDPRRRAAAQTALDAWRAR